MLLPIHGFAGFACEWHDLLLYFWVRTVWEKVFENYLQISKQNSKHRRSKIRTNHGNESCVSVNHHGEQKAEEQTENDEYKKAHHLHKIYCKGGMRKTNDGLPIWNIVYTSEWTLRLSCYITISIYGGGYTLCTPIRNASFFIRFWTNRCRDFKCQR